MKILIIEDVDIQAKTEKLMMQSICKDAQIDTADSCEAARDKVAQTPYDIILFDFGLPDGDGLELVKEFREQGSTAYMHAVSGNYDAVPLEEQQAAGLNGGCRKPLSLDKAQEIINNYHNTHQE